MKLKELTMGYVSFSSPNQYVHPHYEECINAYRMWHNKNGYSRTRGNVRNRFSHIVAVCKKHGIPMFSYGNNDTGYAYLQVGFALPEKYINEAIMHELEPYIDYLDLIAIMSESDLDKTDGEGAFVAVGVRWLKNNSCKLGRYGYSYAEAARIYDKIYPNYTNK